MKIQNFFVFFIFNRKTLETCPKNTQETHKKHPRKTQETHKNAQETHKKHPRMPNKYPIMPKKHTKNTQENILKMTCRKLYENL